MIIAARNAARTIPAAIASALREPEVAEVVVVDDASTDDTAKVARAADDGSGRLSVMRLDINKGPSFARNAAIAGSNSPFISILDADDFFLEGRFRRLFASTDWDFAADNIMLIRDDTATDVSKIVAPPFSADPEFLDFERFIEGNISRRRVQRGELGFLKPVITKGLSSTATACATTKACALAKITNSMHAPLPLARASRSYAPAAMARSFVPIC